MFVMKFKKYFVGFSAILVFVSLFLFFTKGLNIGIEFTGGTIMEVAYIENTRPEIEIVKTAIEDLEISAQVQEFGDDNIVIRMQDFETGNRQVILESISFENNIPELVRLDSIGPSLGAELQNKALWAIGIVSIAIILFVAFAFRQVSKPVSSWKYGVVAVIALLHDIAIPVGIWALFGFEVNSLFVVGLLSILGLSVNDTIVVFDRVRENLKRLEEENVDENFDETVGRSLKQTVSRSIFTSLTLFVVLLALMFFGPAATRDLALVLAIGTVVGTYSSIFLASPLLTIFAKKS